MSVHKRINKVHELIQVFLTCLHVQFHSFDSFSNLESLLGVFLTQYHHQFYQKQLMKLCSFKKSSVDNHFTSLDAGPFLLDYSNSCFNSSIQSQIAGR
jgi:hypothetical protein